MKTAGAGVTAEGAGNSGMLSQLSWVVTDNWWYPGVSSVLMHDVCTN